MRASFLLASAFVAVAAQILTASVSKGAPASISRMRTDASPKFSIVYAFNGSGGANPQSNVVLDAVGNLFGVTATGGSANGGVVFEVDTTGHESVLHSFTGGSDGSTPWGVTVDVSDNVYGTTQYGGSNVCNGGGCGVVYRIDAQGSFTTLHEFTSGQDGAQPMGGVVLDSTGNLYGTTSFGGISRYCKGHAYTTGCGTIFKVDSTSVESVLYSFLPGRLGGNTPLADLVLDPAGAPYGTTLYGGNQAQGVVFKLDSQGGYTVLHNFKGPNGSNPRNGLLRVGAGTLYGQTELGGSFGYGVVFKLTGSREVVLHDFTGGADGGFPTGELVRDAAGNLYGVTNQGGIPQQVCFNVGCGVIYKISPSGQETVLYSFTGGDDGFFPEGGLAFDAKTGTLYGTAYQGGKYRAGVVFRIKP